MTRKPCHFSPRRACRARPSATVRRAPNAHDPTPTTQRPRPNAHGPPPPLQGTHRPETHGPTPTTQRPGVQRPRPNAHGEADLPRCARAAWSDPNAHSPKCTQPRAVSCAVSSEPPSTGNPPSRLWTIDALSPRPTRPVGRPIDVQSSVGVGGSPLRPGSSPTAAASLPRASGRTPVPRERPCPTHPRLSTSPPRLEDMAETPQCMYCPRGRPCPRRPHEKCQGMDVDATTVLHLLTGSELGPLQARALIRSSLTDGGVVKQI